MNLARLKSETLSHMGLSATSNVVDPDRLSECINAAIQDTWRECGGSAPEPLTLDLTAGQSDYPLDRVAPLDRVDGVLVRERVGGEPYRLRYLPASSTAWSEGTGRPCLYTVRLTGLRPGAAGFEPDSVSTVGYIGGPALRVLPAPDTTIAGGLIIETAGASGDLFSDTDTSPLPRDVLSAACWRAAAELALDYSDDPALAARVGTLGARADAALKSAQRAIRRMGGGMRPIVPAYGFNGCTPDNDFGDYGREWLPDYATETDMRDNRWRFDVVPTPGASSFTADISAYPADYTKARTAQAFSDQLGFLSPPTFATDGKTAMVGLAGGIVFPPNDIVFIYYDLAS